MYPTRAPKRVCASGASGKLGRHLVRLSLERAA